MDTLSWILICWICLAAVIFLVMQKAFEVMPSLSYRAATKRDAGCLTDSRQLSMATAVSNSYQSMDNPTTAATTPTTTKPVVESAKWVNDFFQWLLSRYNGTPNFMHSWIGSMNSISQKFAESVGCEVTFEDVHLNAHSFSPHFYNFQTESESGEYFTLRFSVDCDYLKLPLVATAKLPEKLVVTNYETTLSNLKAVVGICY
ncbi:unnamed protein product [Soboliphyme baturini]|uniref:SMP-LTD domain-containing protein n=1 Tax=Soboliphyme baturini TaxID=241478 RepID=A0A183IVZ0_9BILA|nr:unnamed protein product [Soboliphyme baturini]